jgi:hypothetical protein
MLELLNQLDGFEASNKIKVRRDAVFVLLCRGTCVHAWLYSATCVD